ncbi:hypothetical protein [Roseateles koreensis]|uniref:Uncharacterized protein n=1 Tax=Roseateles koreensis TaxID=2987526 RepID=A0ABT5KLI3_9BURK|nr:hypothetical protein [Roseateles koreensis]MDC8783768.1 hypothetical protein [Roseateles koreensis]
MQILDLGRPQSLSALGEPLLLRLPLRWPAGEALNTACLAARVVVGEQQLGESEVQKSLALNMDAQTGVLSLRTRAVVDEPVVRVMLGCPAQQVVVLMDPAPTAAPEPVLAADPPQLPEALMPESSRQAVAASQALPMQAPSAGPLVVRRPAVAKSALRPAVPKAGLQRAGLHMDALAFSSVAVTSGTAHAAALQAESSKPGQASASASTLLLVPTSLEARLASAESTYRALQLEQHALQLEAAALSLQLRQYRASPWHRWGGVGLLAMGVCVTLLLTGGTRAIQHRQRGRQRSLQPDVRQAL